jgi:hypothetical protein
MKIEVSIGEVVDKVTILEIKKEKITNVEKLQNIIKEYNLLRSEIEKIGINVTSEEYLSLKEVNLRLWHIEDDIRIEELHKNFEDRFIQLARSVYFENDTRAELKKIINLKYGSELIEEKEYVEYKK